MGTSTPPLIVLKELAGNVPTHLDSVQRFFEPHTDSLVHFWVAVWFATSLYLILHVASEYSAHRRNRDR